MFNQELKQIYSQYYQDISLYKTILGETLQTQLIPCLKGSEEVIIERLKELARDGKNQLTIKFISQTIYENPVAVVYAENEIHVSIESCIMEYVYEKRLLGLSKRQVKFTDIDFKSFYHRFESNVRFHELTVFKEVLEENPSIELELVNYFKKLGLKCEISKFPHFFQAVLTF